MGFHRLIFVRVFLLLVTLLVIVCCQHVVPPSSLGSHLYSPQHFDKGFDNPMLKTLSPKNWTKPRFWWLADLKTNNSQTFFGQVTNNKNNKTNGDGYTFQIPSKYPNEDNNRYINQKSSVPNQDSYSDQKTFIQNNSTVFNYSDGISEEYVYNLFGHGTIPPERLAENPVPVNVDSISETPPRSTIPINLNPLPENDGEVPCDCINSNLCFENGTIKTKGNDFLQERLGNFKRSEQDCFPPDLWCCLPGTPLPTMGCGLQSRDPFPFTERISSHDFDQTYEGEFPWMIALTITLPLKDKNNDIKFESIFKCGGVIIDKQFALTAAHCLYDKGKPQRKRYPTSSFKIRAGIWDLSVDNEQIQDRKLNDIIIHPKFDISTLAYDIAILKFESSLKFDHKVGKICLPTEEEQLLPTPPECLVSGWGKDKFGVDAEIRPELKKIRLPLVAHNECQERLRKSKVTRYFILDRSFICAGGIENRDACKGDGGSPLVCRIPETDRYHLTGLVSWGIDCGTNFPGAYVNVAKDDILSWIKEQIGRENF